MKPLFRGYVGSRLENFEPLLESSIDLSDVVEQGERFWPHTTEFDHALVWVTPIRDYAEAIVNARFIIDYCLEEDFKQQVQEGNYSPCVAVMHVDETNAFNYSDGTLTKFQGRTAPEMIVQICSDYDVLRPTDTNIQSITQLWDETIAMEIPGFKNFLDELQRTAGNSRVNAYVDRHLTGNIKGSEAMTYLVNAYSETSIFSKREFKEKILSSFLPHFDTTNIVYN